MTLIWPESHHRLVEGCLKTVVTESGDGGSAVVSVVCANDMHWQKRITLPKISNRTVQNSQLPFFLGATSLPIELSVSPLYSSMGLGGIRLRMRFPLWAE